MLEIYSIYIRSVVEQAAVVWHSSLSKGDQLDLERVQKMAVKILLKHQYTNYTHAPKTTGIPTLKARRNDLCLKVVKNCVKNSITSDTWKQFDSEHKAT